VVSDGAALSMRDGAGAVDVLHWTWLAAGVPVLLLPRWAVDPSASEALLVEFHRQVREGVAPGEALRKARAALRARAETAAPWYWAGWMLLGR
jgi:CHAT domain-containing protein